jgi:hypothetical protein
MLVRSMMFYHFSFPFFTSSFHSTKAMGADLAKLFIDPATLPGGEHCVNPLKSCPESGLFPALCMNTNNHTV